MAVTKKTGFELEQLVARQIYMATLKLPDSGARVRALQHVLNATMQSSIEVEQKRQAGEAPRNQPWGPQEAQQLGIAGVGSISRI